MVQLAYTNIQRRAVGGGQATARDKGERERERTPLEERTGSVGLLISAKVAQAGRQSPEGVSA